jgi:hypothetical protein
VGAVLLVGYALFFAASRNSHNEWYQKGYDADMKASLLSSDMANLACSGAVLDEIIEKGSSSHENDIKRSCHDAINKRLEEKHRYDSP